MKQNFFILFLLMAQIVLAQTPTLQANVSKSTVTENEVFTYQIVSNSDCEITPPDFGNLEIVEGPVQGISKNTVFTNNVQTNVQEYSFTYYLRASKKGTYNISAATMKCKMKKVISSPAVSVKVIVAKDAIANQETNSAHFLKLTTNKNSVYIGEPFVLTLKFYSPKKPNNFEPVRSGAASGLWRTDLNPNQEVFNMSFEDIKGVRYYVLELRKELCIPLRTGKITIEPYISALLIQIDIFTNERLEGISNSLTIDVKKIPFETPDNFNGLVGQFKLRQVVDKTSLVQGQVLELNLTLSGTGNFNAFDELKLNLPEGFSQNDPEITNETNPTEDGLNGELKYKFILTAEEPGDYEFQPFSFSYFDIKEKKIKEIVSETIKIHIDKGDENHNKIYNTQNTVEIKDTDIHYIHDEKGTPFLLTDFFFGTIPYLLLVFCPIILVLTIAYFKRKKSNITEEVKVETKQKIAKKAALKTLAHATYLLKKSEEKEALKMIHNALITFFITKLNLSLSTLSQRSITSELELKKVDTQLILQFTHIWKNIEMAQYAPITTANLQETITASEKLIHQLNEKI